MTKEEFKSLMTQAGYKKKHELAKELGISYQAVNNWGSSQAFPHYIEAFLHKAIKAKKYDELMADSQKK